MKKYFKIIIIFLLFFFSYSILYATENEENEDNKKPTKINFVKEKSIGIYFDPFKLLLNNDINTGFDINLNDIFWLGFDYTYINKDLEDSSIHLNYSAHKYGIFNKIIMFDKFIPNIFITNLGLKYVDYTSKESTVKFNATLFFSEFLFGFQVVSKSGYNIIIALGLGFNWALNKKLVSDPNFDTRTVKNNDNYGFASLGGFGWAF